MRSTKKAGVGITSRQPSNNNAEGGEKVPLSDFQAVQSCISSCQNAQNMIRHLADTTPSYEAKDELNKAFLSIDACIKQCQTASSKLM